MPNYIYAACDGGTLNTLAGGGGIVEVMLEPEFRTRYFEFPDGMGGSTHMVIPTPDRSALVASSANIGQIFVIPREGDSYNFEAYRVINGFNELGPPELGTDAQTAMFDFLDNEHIVCQYNRKLIKVNLASGALEVIADIKAFAPKRANILHQISVTENYIIVDEVVQGGIYVYDRRSSELFFMGDGFSGGHHLPFKDENGDTIVLRPAFGFQSVDAHLKLDDNSMTFYNLDKHTTRTRCYSWEIPNHFPTDMHLEGEYLYLSFAVPGSVCKIRMSDGRIVKRFNARPGVLTRYFSMVFDALYYQLDYGTMRNRHDSTVFSVNQIAHAFAMGRASGTRAGFFAMGTDKDLDELYICHRGLNKVFCLDKENLKLRWSRPLPSRNLNSPMVGLMYRSFPYFRRCLGVHHGSFVRL